MGIYYCYYENRKIHKHNKQLNLRKKLKKTEIKQKKNKFLKKIRLKKKLSIKYKETLKFTFILTLEKLKKSACNTKQHINHEEQILLVNIFAKNLKRKNSNKHRKENGKKHDIKLVVLKRKQIKYRNLAKFSSPLCKKCEITLKNDSKILKYQSSNNFLPASKSKTSEKTLNKILENSTTSSTISFTQRMLYPNTMEYLFRKPKNFKVVTKNYQAISTLEIEILEKNQAQGSKETLPLQKPPENVCKKYQQQYQKVMKNYQLKSPKNKTPETFHSQACTTSIIPNTWFSHEIKQILITKSQKQITCQQQEVLNKKITEGIKYHQTSLKFPKLIDYMNQLNTIYYETQNFIIYQRKIKSKYSVTSTTSRICPPSQIIGDSYPYVFCFQQKYYPLKNTTRLLLILLIGKLPLRHMDRLKYFLDAECQPVATSCMIKLAFSGSEYQRPYVMFIAEKIKNVREVLNCPPKLQYFTESKIHRKLEKEYFGTKDHLHQTHGRGSKIYYTIRV